MADGHAELLKGGACESDFRRKSAVCRLGSAALAFAAAPQYKIVDRIKVQDGGFDYATFDPATNQVLMARPNFTTTIDVKTGKVGEIKAAATGPHRVADTGNTLLVVTQRAGNILIVDGKADKVEATLKGDKNPDGATYDPSTKLVFAMNHDSGNSTVMDPVAKKVVGTIPDRRRSRIRRLQTETARFSSMSRTRTRSR